MKTPKKKKKLTKNDDVNEVERPMPCAEIGIDE